ncbi:MAG TPA: NAD(P)-binding protein [Candidatus Nanoarchaeia archaeon]|nr:NAD(P)-binding protein [Candidatus Nanoarchaeia archaeon]
MTKRGDFYEFAVSKQMKLILLIIIGLLLFGTIGYMLLQNVGFWQGFIYTLETFAFEHETNHTVVGKMFQLILLVVGVIILWACVWTMFEFMIEGKFNQYFQQVRIMKKVNELRKHYLICGGGRVGSHVADLLKIQHKKYVIMEREETLVNDLQRNGYTAMEGDAMEEKDLVSAGLLHAQALIVVLPEIEKNIFTILTARELRPDLVIYARADRPHMVKKLKNAGAKHIVLPEMVCAEEIVHEIAKEEGNVKRPFYH